MLCGKGKPIYCFAAENVAQMLRDVVVFIITLAAQCWLAVIAGTRTHAQQMT